tara:strand:- start:1 stop:780 length:780 start_codon:yes stop_codon:yes gene_type:complete
MRPIKINPKMRGVFTKKAKRKKMSVQKYANYVIKKYKGKKKTKKQLKLLRQAVFAKTAKKWKKRKKKRGGVGDEEIGKFSTLEELLTLLVGVDHTVYVRKDFESLVFPEPKGETIAYEMDPKNWTISRLTTEGILLAPSEDREVEGKMETRVLSWKLIKNGRIKIKRSNDTDAPFFKYVNPRRRSFGGRRKKTRKKRSKGGDYSPMAKKLLEKKARKLRKATKKIQPVVRGYLTRKNLLPPPPRPQGYDPFWGSDEDDY